MKPEGESDAITNSGRHHTERDWREGERMRQSRPPTTSAKLGIESRSLSSRVDSHCVRAAAGGLSGSKLSLQFKAARRRPQN
jgi:hypothetical protein